MNKYNKHKYDNKFLKFEDILRNKIKKAEKDYNNHKDNFGENEPSYLFVISSLKELLNEFLKIKNTDFRVKELKQ